MDTCPMDTATAPASSSKPLAAHSCQRCAARKIKCDKQQPCGACVKSNAECEHRLLPRPKRRKRQDRNEVLVRRLEQYERLLHQKVAGSEVPPKDPEDLSSSRSSYRSDSTVKDVKNSPLSRPSGLSVTHPMSALPQDQVLVRDENRSKYLDNGLWARVVEELGEPGDALEHSSDELSDEDVTIQDGTDLMLGLTPTTMNLYHLHPPRDHMTELWRVFLENVDPVTKVLHGPSLQPVIQKASLDASAIPKSLEALLFAIYSAAVVTLNDHDCERIFGESRKSLLSQYRLATKVALSRAKFIGSANLVVLQAFYIHLLSMREVYDSRTLWTLTGVALRMAEGMGLHRNGLFLHLPPFETEIRHRIWWQLKIFEGDSAELSGSGKFTISDSDPKATQPPSNINDNEFYPGISSLPVAKGRATDMVFCALRYELRSYWTSNDRFKRLRLQDQSTMQTIFGKTEAMNAVRERDEAIDEFERLLEDKYVRYCDPSIPIQLMATVAARVAVSNSRLMAHHPRTWVSQEEIPESERQYVWNLSLKGLRQFSMLHSNRELQRFSWHAAFYFRWQPFINTLDILRVSPLIQEADQAWRLVDEVYETNPEFASNTKKALYVAVGNLCLKAYDAREAALAKQSRLIPTPPSYIDIFRRQREAANARRRDREAAKRKSEHQIEKPPIFPQPTFNNLQTTSHFPSRSQEQMSSPAQTQQSQQPFPSYMINPQQTDIFNGGNGWLPTGDSDQSSGMFAFTNDTTNLDLDMLLDPDALTEESMNQTIDWSKWDALLGDFT